MNRRWKCYIFSSPVCCCEIGKRINRMTFLLLFAVNSYRLWSFKWLITAFHSPTCTWCLPLPCYLLGSQVGQSNRAVNTSREHKLRSLHYTKRGKAGWKVMFNPFSLSPQTTHTDTQHCKYPSPRSSHQLFKEEMQHFLRPLQSLWFTSSNFPHQHRPLQQLANSATSHRCSEGTRSIHQLVGFHLVFWFLNNLVLFSCLYQNFHSALLLLRKGLNISSIKIIVSMGFGAFLPSRVLECLGGWKQIKWRRTSSLKNFNLSLMMILIPSVR